MQTKHPSDEAFEAWVTSGGGEAALRSHAVQAAFREGWNAREKAPNTIIIDTTSAQMTPSPNVNAAAPIGIPVQVRRESDAFMPEFEGLKRVE